MNTSHNLLHHALNKEWENLVSRYPYMQDENWMRDRTIILFGTGGAYLFDAPYFSCNHISIDFLCENNKLKWHTIIDGIPCIPPGELHTIKNPFVFVCVRNFEYAKQICNQLRDMGIDHTTFYSFIPILDRDKVLQVHSLLSDDCSREVYARVVLARIAGERIDASFFNREQYFALNEFVASDDPNEVFVDAGAFVGSVTEQFIWSRLGNFSKIYCFEPGDGIFDALQVRMRRLRGEWALGEDSIACIKAGLGAHSGTATCTVPPNGGTCSSVLRSADSGSAGVSMHRLDDLLAEGRLDFLKADIEGGELDMLAGAAATIRRCRPKVAVCIYHKAGDIYEIPLKMKDLVPEYRLAVRHHSLAFADTVLYCSVP